MSYYFWIKPFLLFPGGCIASRFALMEIKTLFFYLLLNFTIEKCDRTQDPLKLKKHSMVSDAEHGFWIALIPRWTLYIVLYVKRKRFREIRRQKFIWIIRIINFRAEKYLRRFRRKLQIDFIGYWISSNPLKLFKWLILLNHLDKELIKVSADNSSDTSMMRWVFTRSSGSIMVEVIMILGIVSEWAADRR